MLSSLYRVCVGAIIVLSTQLSWAEGPRVANHPSLNQGNMLTVYARLRRGRSRKSGDLGHDLKTLFRAQQTVAGHGGALIQFLPEHIALTFARDNWQAAVDAAKQIASSQGDELHVAIHDAAEVISFGSEAPYLARSDPDELARYLEAPGWAATCLFWAHEGEKYSTAGEIGVDSRALATILNTGVTPQAVQTYLEDDQRQVASEGITFRDKGGNERHLLRLQRPGEHPAAGPAASTSARSSKRSTADDIPLGATLRRAPVRDGSPDFAHHPAHRIGLPGGTDTGLIVLLDLADSTALAGRGEDGIREVLDRTKALSRMASTYGGLPIQVGADHVAVYFSPEMARSALDVAVEVQKALPEGEDGVHVVIAPAGELYALGHPNDGHQMPEVAAPPRAENRRLGHPAAGARFDTLPVWTATGLARAHEAKGNGRIIIADDTPFLSQDFFAQWLDENGLKRHQRSDSTIELAEVELPLLHPQAPKVAAEGGFARKAADLPNQLAAHPADKVPLMEGVDIDQGRSTGIFANRRIEAAFLQTLGWIIETSDSQAEALRKVAEVAHWGRLAPHLDTSAPRLWAETVVHTVSGDIEGAQAKQTALTKTLRDRERRVEAQLREQLIRYETGWSADDVATLLAASGVKYNDDTISLVRIPDRFVERLGGNEAAAIIAEYLAPDLLAEEGVPSWRVAARAAAYHVEVFRTALFDHVRGIVRQAQGPAAAAP